MASLSGTLDPSITRESPQIGHQGNGSTTASHSSEHADGGAGQLLKAETATPRNWEGWQSGAAEKIKLGELEAERRRTYSRAP